MPYCLFFFSPIINYSLFIFLHMFPSLCLFVSPHFMTDWVLLSSPWCYGHKQNGKGFDQMTVIFSVPSAWRLLNIHFVYPSRPSPQIIHSSLVLHVPKGYFFLSTIPCLFLRLCFQSFCWVILAKCPHESCCFPHNARGFLKRALPVFSEAVYCLPRVPVGTMLDCSKFINSLLHAILMAPLRIWGAWLWFWSFHVNNSHLNITSTLLSDPTVQDSWKDTGQVRSLSFTV